MQDDRCLPILVNCHHFPGKTIQLVGVEPEWLIADVMDLICYGTSHRGGSCYRGGSWCRKANVCPFPDLRLRTQMGGNLEIDRTVSSYNITPWATLYACARSWDSGWIFLQRAWSQLNGEYEYFHESAHVQQLQSGRDLRLFASERARVEDHRNMHASNLRLILIGDDDEPSNREIGDDFDDWSSLFLDQRARVTMLVKHNDGWIRRRNLFLIAEKGVPTTVALLPFKSVPELKLLNFIQRITPDLFQRIALFL